MTGFSAKPHILTIAPYIGGEAKGTTRLASNESAYGPPPAAIEALRHMATDIHRYPDGMSEALREALGKKHGIVPGQIVCGAGSEELIRLLAQAYAGSGDEILYPQYGFLMYSIAAKAVGATGIAAPETSLTADVDALLARVTPRTKLLYLANPNNPTGTMLPRAEIARLHKNLPPHVLLILDAAYCEFVTREDYSAGDELVAAGNVVVLRTFSKIYALAGLRLGWAHCPPAVADALNRVRGPFNVSAPAQVAGLAALGEEAFIHHAKTMNEKVKAAFVAALPRPSVPSACNFVLAEFGPEAEKTRQKLKEKGILVRQMGAYGLPHCLRITIGTSGEMEQVLNALK
jgi:histidinol-phosphate aminotransferase